VLRDRLGRRTAIVDDDHDLGDAVAAVVWREGDDSPRDILISGTVAG
jgi:hypothetical protein